MGGKWLSMHSRTLVLQRVTAAAGSPVALVAASLSHEVCTCPGDGWDKGAGGAPWDADAAENHSDRLHPHRPHSSLCELCTG